MTGQHPQSDMRFSPGVYVRHPDRPDWGVGQVQSAIGNRVTANFEHAGKRVVNIAVVALEPIDPEAAGGNAGSGP